jgi:hypothetical protein
LKYLQEGWTVRQMKNQSDMDELILEEDEFNIIAHNISDKVVYFFNFENIFV